MLKSLFRRRARRTLTREQQSFWAENGFLVLEGAVAPEALSRYVNEVSELLEHRAERAGPVTVDILQGPEAGRRLLGTVSDDALTRPFKINDLFLELESCRQLCLSTYLKGVLHDLLGGEPLVINSLTFGKGSQQPYHFDTWYMPPPVANAMAVSSICLEDQSERSGPLTYYPGSHRIPPYRFSHGGIHAVEAEMDQAREYIESAIAERGLQPADFIGRCGEVFIWHAQLFHGGRPIQDPKTTRRTLVTHYWRAGDVERQRVARSPFGAHLRRDHPQV